jgi:hypothetical protein
LRQDFNMIKHNSSSSNDTLNINYSKNTTSNIELNESNSNSNSLNERQFQKDFNNDSLMIKTPVVN